MDEQMIDIAKSICRELCAECGDPPCYEVDPEHWLESPDPDVHCRCVINAKLAHSVMAGKVAELTAENARLKMVLYGARAASKRQGRDLLREEADAALPSFGTEWEPLRCVADRADAQSASWLVSRARDLQRRGLVESRWIGKERTSSLKVWRVSVGDPPVDAALAPHPERRSEYHE